MKILFLNIDGVCNSLDYARRSGNMNLINKIDPAAAKLVKKIVAETGCKVVLSSTWRLYPKSMEIVKREVCELLGVTPNLGTAKRGQEVEAWLAEHSEVERYAILDDNSDFFKRQPLFKTGFAMGLTKDIANSVIRYLNRSM